jgi:hypothetical protein
MISRRAFLVAAPALAVGVTQLPALVAALPPPLAPSTLRGATMSKESLYFLMSRDVTVDPHKLLEHATAAFNIPADGLSKRTRKARRRRRR